MHPSIHSAPHGQRRWKWSPRARAQSRSKCTRIGPRPAQRGQRPLVSERREIEPLRLTPFERTVALTRQMVLADDFVSFTAMVDALGVAAAACEADSLYDLVVANPPLADGQPLFSAAHKNLMPAAALTAESLATACAALAAQTAASGAPLHLVARYLLVGTKPAPAARALVVPPTPATPDAAASAGALEVLCEPRLPDGVWYVTASPSQGRTLVTAHLQDEPEPVLEARDGWEVDAREYRGRLDFGAAVADWRGMVMTPAV